MVNFLNVYGPGLAILFVVFVEAAGVFWFYGVDNFSNDVESMLGQRPGLYWRVCWMYISPIFLLVIFIFSLLGYEEMLGEEYEYPDWSIALGWTLTLSSILCIPTYIVYKILITPGSIQKVSNMNEFMFFSNFCFELAIFTFEKCSMVVHLSFHVTKKKPSHSNADDVDSIPLQRFESSFKPQDTEQPTAIPGQIVCGGTAV